MKKLFITAFAFYTFSVAYTQNVGIGTTTPNSSALLHVDLGASTTNGLLVTGTFNSSATVPDLGTGPRMMFYPGKAAFRAGMAYNANWDNSNVGFYSIAMGHNTIASGYASVAIGANVQATGFDAVAIGGSANATGIGSFASGNGVLASGSYAFAAGFNSIASGNYSYAFGNTVTGSGNFSTAMGNYVSTTNYEGAYVLGDHSTTTVMQSFVANGFRSRFAGGYRLLTNSAANLGVVLVPDATSWSAISDVRLKENFLPVNGENILTEISRLSLTTWNYKAQSNKISRHYGPMAQDFYAAFGKDKMGTIGCDTLINQQDFLGVNLIAIQALEKRTQKIELLEKENTELRNMLLLLRKEVDELKLKK